jgi:hypothetical protein
MRSSCPSSLAPFDDDMGSHLKVMEKLDDFLQGRKTAYTDWRFLSYGRRQVSTK